MATCYWQLCDCPTVQPCTEHAGLHCSILNGKAVSDPTQINDAVTLALDARIKELDGDAKKLAEIKARIEAYKARLEKDKADIERAMDAATNRSERSAAVDQAKQANDRADETAQEILKIAQELNTLSTPWMLTAMGASGRLITPFIDTTGYCSCYARKQQALAAVAAEIASQRAIYVANWTAYSSFRTTMINYYRYVLGGLVAIEIGIWIWFGIGKAALVATLVFEIVIVIALVAAIAYVEVLLSRMNEATRQIALLTELYYRVQQIPTCQKPPNTQNDETWLELLFDQIERILHKGG